MSEAPALVEVAVPIPLKDPLTYAVPETFADRIAPGMRVRVQVGQRRLVGVVMAFRSEAPEGFRIREVLEVLDLEPVLPTALLELASFAARYYLAPIGDTLRALIPPSLPRWGDLRVALTDAGAIAPPADAQEAELIEVLLTHRRMRLAELQRRLPGMDLGRRIASLRRRGRLSVEEPGRRGLRYLQAYERKPGELEQQLAACGRSPKGRAVLKYLTALERPATGEEIRQAVGCGPSVIRRLVDLGLLRSFTQPERVSLGRHRLEDPGEPRAALVLRPDQQRAVEAVLGALAGRTFSAQLLAGVTGSGKTEVYLRAAEACLEQGRSVLLLVPEIALVPALARLVTERFGDDLAILHSNLSTAERHQEWERVRHGEARIVLGPRSAVFAPLDKLGLVVIDEEHDNSYKQDVVPRYHGRDLALWRARAEGAVAVLASATPSMESRRNVAVGKLGRLELRERAGGGQLPDCILVDLKEEQASRRPGEVSFSGRLREELAAALADGDQTILLRNRRGYAPILLCRACGEDFRCPDCGLPQTYHRRLRRVLCHYCGRERPVPAKCPECREAALEPIGAGTERVEERLQELFPDAVIDVLDADANRRPGGVAAVLERFRRGQTQVLVGTQMVAKGHDFPRVTLAAVLSADTYLGFPDFRAVEKTYALLTQLAGRAGRGERAGRVVIQTFHPDHYAIRAAIRHDDTAFAESEDRFRRVFHYPPYTRMVQLLSRDRDRRRAEARLQELARDLLTHPLAAGIRITGPAPAPLERLQGRWRFQLLLRGPSGQRLRRLVQEVLADTPASQVIVDVDPYDLF